MTDVTHVVAALRSVKRSGLVPARDVGAQGR